MQSKELLRNTVIKNRVRVVDGILLPKGNGILLPEGNDWEQQTKNRYQKTDMSENRLIKNLIGRVCAIVTFRSEA